MHIMHGFDLKLYTIQLSNFMLNAAMDKLNIFLNLTRISSKHWNSVKMYQISIYRTIFLNG